MKERKIDYRKVLTVDYIDGIMKNVCPSGYWYSIEKSKTTNSIYVIIHSGYKSCEIRVSDHESRLNVKSIIVTKSIKRSNLERAFQNSIATLQRNTLYKLLDNETKRLNCA